jgi:predicted Rossmann fold flavoprotein
MAQRSDTAWDAILIGGGPAGMIAGIIAGRRGRKILLLEKGKELGRKLKVTGSGRCNLTNLELGPEHYHAADRELVRAALARFDEKRTREFFGNLGLLTKVEERGRVFPVCHEASAVCALLVSELDRVGVDVMLHSEVVGLERGKDGLQVRQRGNSQGAKRVLLASGGLAGPQFGASPTGLEIAQALGHRVIPTSPWLVPLELESRWQKQLQGVRMDLEVRASLGDKELFRGTGEVMFTIFGISGPLAIRTSGTALEHHQEQGFRLEANFFPGMERAEVDEKMFRRWAEHPEREAGFSFTGWLPARIAPVVLHRAGIDEHRTVKTIRPEERRDLAEAFTHWELVVKGGGSYKEADATAGGVDTREVNPQTLESKLVPGLFFAGEILDVVGDWGGYNLQWAWSSGYVAGNAMAD